jgi:hypothetical protein
MVGGRPEDKLSGAHPLSDTDSTSRRAQARAPPPNPARFLAPPKATPARLGDDKNSYESSPSKLVYASGTDAAETLDIADELDGHSGLHFREGSGNAKKAKLYQEYGSIEDEEDTELLSGTGTPSSKPPSYPPSLRSLNPRTSNGGGHKPVPAITVFSRSAAPLYLPKLDEYISSLPIPGFSKSSRRDPNGKPLMFTPMDRLAASGKSLEDLEMNKSVSPGWRNRSTIFGSLVSLVLGVLVCPYYLWLMV